MMRRQLWKNQGYSSVCVFCTARSSSSSRISSISTPSAPAQFWKVSSRNFSKIEKRSAQDGSSRAPNRPGGDSSWGSNWTLDSFRPTSASEKSGLANPSTRRQNDPYDALLPHEKAARSRALTDTPKGDHDASKLASPLTIRNNAISRANSPTYEHSHFVTQPQQGSVALSRDRRLGELGQSAARQGHPRSGAYGTLLKSNAISRSPSDGTFSKPHESHPVRHTRRSPFLLTTKQQTSAEAKVAEAAEARKPFIDGHDWAQLTRRSATAPSRGGHRPFPPTKGSGKTESSPSSLSKTGGVTLDPWLEIETGLIDNVAKGGMPIETSDSWAWVDKEQRSKKSWVRRETPSLDLSESSARESMDPIERRTRDGPKSTQKSKNVARRNTRYQEEDDEYFDEEVAERAESRRRQKEAKRAQRDRELEAQRNRPTPIFLPELISVANLGMALGVKPEMFLDQLAELGFDEISSDSIMSGETAALIAQEYGFEPSVDTGESIDLKPRPLPTDPSILPARPPIVTIMGHVDHGKTTMLDWLRKTSVAAQEHGGITQHIGAFSVRLSAGRQITFLDTPGHAAFLTMRQRGANVTDIVILVVAVDDSVKPQTLEALKHARSANVPIIVAINKVDKDEARIDQVKADLARHGVEIEDYGGDVQVVCVSGKTGQGMADLEENILTLSEILDMRAESDGMAEGWVLESSIKPVGKAATVLVKRGTLRKGDVIVAGTSWARIRSLRSEAGIELDEAPPGTPVEILGWKDPPAAGDQVIQAPDESKAKDAAHYRKELRDREKSANELALQERREKEAAATADLAEGEQAGSTDDSGTIIVNFTVKGDVMGSVEAVCAAVLEIGNNEVRPAILRSAPGQVTEFDIEHAATSNSSIINFNNPIPGHMKRKAEESGVSILDYTVIYHLTDAIKAKLSEELTPTISTRVLGEAEVLQVFPINTKGRIYKNIAGCRVRNGQVTRGASYRVIRNGEKIFDGKLESLKQGKKDAAEMKKGAECGISFEEWQEFKQGDQIQAYEEVKEKRSL